MTRDNPRENYYVISIQPTGEVEVGFVLLAVYYLNGSTTNPSLCSIQALEIDLKYGAQQKYHNIFNFYNFSNIFFLNFVGLFYLLFWLTIIFKKMYWRFDYFRFVKYACFTGN